MTTEERSSYLGKVLGGLGSLLTGLRITMVEFGRTAFRRKAVTLQYPREEPELSPNFRSAIKLINFEEIDSHDCVACMQCVKICPSFCIEIDGGKIEGIKKKRATRFHMDFALCSLCGLCLDVCPTATLEYSKIYDAAGYQRDWTFDLLAEFADREDKWRAEQRERDLKAAEEKKKKAAAAKAAREAKKAKAAAETKAETKAVETGDKTEAAAKPEPDPKEPA